MGNQCLLDLVKKAAQGDQIAFEKLYEIKIVSVLYQSRQILGSYADAEDVAQIVAYRVYTNLKNLRTPELFNVWLRRIIVNECRMYMRSKRVRREQANLDDFKDFLPEEKEEFLPFEYAQDAEKRQMLLDIVHKLPARQQEAVLLYYYEDMSIAEVAAAMNTSQSNAKVSLFKARSQIRKALEKRTSEPLDKIYSIAGVGAVPVLKLVLDFDAAHSVPEKSIHTVLDACHHIIQGGGASMALASTAVQSLPYALKLTGIVSVCVASMLLAVAIATNPAYPASPPQTYAPNASPFQGSPEDPQPSSLAKEAEDLDISDPQGPFPTDQQPGGESAAPPVGASPTPGVNGGGSTPTPGTQAPANTKTPAPPPTAVTFIHASLAGNAVLVDSAGNALAYSGNLLSGLDILLQDPYGQEIARATTGMNGEYAFENLRLAQAQRYVLRFSFGNRTDLLPAAAGASEDAFSVFATENMVQNLYLRFGEVPTGLISLSGGQDEGTYINPSAALLLDFTPLDTEIGWSILSALSNEVFYTGSGPLVEGELAKMIKEAPEGLYLVMFVQKDAAGNEAVHKKSFYIAYDD